jgi:hypothetical protein
MKLARRRFLFNVKARRDMPALKQFLAKLLAKQREHPSQPMPARARERRR